MRVSLAQKAAEEKEIYGRWQVQEVVAASTRKVKAMCLDCTTIYIVDLYSLRRKDRNNTRCRSCTNKIISANNRQGPGEALLKNVFHYYKKNAKTRELSWNLSFDAFCTIILSRCWYCNSDPSRIVESSWDSILVNGVDRIDSNLGYQDDNVVSCCQHCNYAKRKMSQSDFISLCRKVVDNDNRRNRT